MRISLVEIAPPSWDVIVDLAYTRELDMGTGFDEFTSRTHQGSAEIPAGAQRNRARLLGLMTAAGWGICRNEWWHCQPFDAGRFPLYSDTALKHGPM